MKPILTIRHVPHEGLGLLADVFTDAGLPWHYADTYRGERPAFEPAEYSGLVVMGGPMNVDETDRHPHLLVEVEWIQRALAAELPLLGVCLGAQLLAKSLGAAVYPNGTKEIGWSSVELTDEADDDRLLTGCQRTISVFQWHGDTFDLPQGAALLAEGDVCGRQAFRYGASAYGFQFHIEMTDELLGDWLANPQMCTEIDATEGCDIDSLRREAVQEMPAVQALGRRVFDQFAAICHERDGGEAADNHSL